jgi:indole-3-glycerol phosphate synthase
VIRRSPYNAAVHANPSSFLARATEGAARLTAERARTLPLDAVRAAAATAPAARGLRAALAAGDRRGINVIAEVKRRSPSKGPIRLDLDAPLLAKAYERGGASAISVLTEPEHFSGSAEDLRAVRAAVELPVLRKDFVTTPYQVWESRAWGADGVLLIVAALDEARLRALLAEAGEAGLDALVEVHDAEEAAIAAAAGATLVGVNARNLATLEVDPGRFAEIRADLPAGAVVVAESGIRNRADVEVVEAAGADAVLVGESLVRSDDPAAAVAALRGERDPARGTDGEAGRPATAGEPRSRRWQA